MRLIVCWLQPESGGRLNAAWQVALSATRLHNAAASICNTMGLVPRHNLTDKTLQGSPMFTDWSISLASAEACMG
jgi:hypothetical protein